MRTLTALAAAALLALLGACRADDLGSGINTVSRDYSRPAPDVWKAAEESVRSADLEITSARHDRLGGELLARRAEGRDVRIHVRSLDEKRCRVSVRFEPGDRDLASLLHERIAAGVGLGEATAGFFGGDSLEAEYPADLKSCLAPARRAFAAAGAEVTAEETHASWARIDGRLRDSTPARIRLDRVGDLRTRVAFIAGTVKSDDHRALVLRLKEEFESRLALEGEGE